MQVLLRIRDVYPGSEFFPSRILIFPSRIPIRIKEISIFLTKKKWFLSSRKYDPDCSSRIGIPDPEPDFLPIPDPGSRGQKATGSATLLRWFVCRKSDEWIYCIIFPFGRKIAEIGSSLRPSPYLTALKFTRGKCTFLRFN